MRNGGGLVAMCFVVGCSADVTSIAPDAAVPVDATTTTTSDAGPRIQRSCPYGSEGCACAAGFGSALFRRDDCAPGLLCVSWHEQRPSGSRHIYRQDPDSCVRPCASDAECGAGRACRDVGVRHGDEALWACVDEVVGMDEFCGASRRTTSLAAGIYLRTPGVMRGCSDDLTCQHFTDHHAEEGVCVVLCDEHSDCPAEVPHCNPTEEIGVCSLRRNGFGAECGSRVPTKAGAINKCDGSPEVRRLTCVSTSGVNANFGFCMMPCSADEPCEGEEEGIGPLNCDSGVYCGVACTDAPDNCSGEGAGFGRFCNRFSTNGRSYNVCIDRLGPPLRPATINASGVIDGREADDCYPDRFLEDPELAIRDYRCPEPTVCVSFLGPDPFGICVPGCDDRTPETGDLYCAEVMSSTTAQCVHTLRGVFDMCGDG